jgi:GT2 family glycosyltransferase
MINPLLGGPDLPRILFKHEAVPGLVSVIVPAWKAGSHLAATLRSLGRQSYPDWELVVVEDGSADATRQIVGEFAVSWPKHRIHYLRHDHSLGPSAARNTGFAAARGQYVALLDADDQWFPDHLAESIVRLEDDRSDITYSAVIMVDDESGRPLGSWGPTPADLACFPRNLLGRNSVVPSATVLRRTVLEEVGGWHLGLRYAEDVFYWLACAKAGKTFSFLPGIHCTYTKNRRGSATQRLAETTTSFAWVVESFLADPASRPLPMGDREATCWIADIYRAAARTHLHGWRHGDHSADLRLAYACAVKAWRVRPLRFAAFWLLVRTAAQSALAGRQAAPQPPETRAPAAGRRAAA